MNYEVIPNKMEKMDFVREFRKNLIAVWGTVNDDILKSNIDLNTSIDLSEFGKNSDGHYVEKISEFLSLALTVEGLTEEFDEVSSEELRSIADELKDMMKGV